MPCLLTSQAPSGWAAATSATRPRATRQSPVIGSLKALLLGQAPERATDAQLQQLGTMARHLLERGHLLREDPTTDSDWLTLIFWQDGRPTSIAELQELIASRYQIQHGHPPPQSLAGELEARLTRLHTLLQRNAKRLGPRRITVLLDIDNLLAPIPLAELDTETDLFQLFAKGGRAHPDLNRPETINFTLIAAYASRTGFGHILRHELQNLREQRTVKNATTRLARAAAHRARAQHQVVYEQQPVGSEPEVGQTDHRVEEAMQDRLAMIGEDVNFFSELFTHATTRFPSELEAVMRVHRSDDWRDRRKLTRITGQLDAVVLKQSGLLQIHARGLQWDPTEDQLDRAIRLRNNLLLLLQLRTITHWPMADDDTPFIDQWGEGWLEIGGMLVEGTDFPQDRLIDAPDMLDFEACLIAVNTTLADRGPTLTPAQIRLLKRARMLTLLAVYVCYADDLLPDARVSQGWFQRMIGRPQYRPPPIPPFGSRAPLPPPSSGSPGAPFSTGADQPADAGPMPGGQGSGPGAVHSLRRAAPSG